MFLLLFYCNEIYNCASIADENNPYQQYDLIPYNEYMSAINQTFLDDIIKLHHQNSENCKSIINAIYRIFYECSQTDSKENTKRRMEEIGRKITNAIDSHRIQINNLFTNVYKVFNIQTQDKTEIYRNSLYNTCTLYSFSMLKTYEILANNFIDELPNINNNEEYNKHKQKTIANLSFMFNSTTVFYVGMFYNAKLLNFFEFIDENCDVFLLNYAYDETTKDILENIHKTNEYMDYDNLLEYFNMINYSKAEYKSLMLTQEKLFTLENTELREEYEKIMCDTLNFSAALGKTEHIINEYKTLELQKIYFADQDTYINHKQTKIKMFYFMIQTIRSIFENLTIQKDTTEIEMISVILKLQQASLIADNYLDFMNKSFFELEKKMIIDENGIFSVNNKKPTYKKIEHCLYVITSDPYNVVLLYVDPSDGTKIERQKNTNK